MSICGVSRRRLAAFVSLFALAAVAATASASAANGNTCPGVLGPVVVHGDLVVPSGTSCELVGTTVLGSVLVEPTASLTATGANVSGRVDCDGAVCGLDSTRVGSTLRGTGGAALRAVGGSYKEVYCSDAGSDCQLDLTADLTRPTVAGNALAVQSSALTVTGADIGGSILCNGCSGFNVDSATIDGHVSSKNHGGLTVLTNDAVDGNVQVMFGNAVVALDNTIGGNLQFTQNSGSLNIFSNEVGGNLLLTANSGEITLIDNHMGGAIVCANSTAYGAGNTAKKTNGNCGILAV